MIEGRLPSAFNHGILRSLGLAEAAPCIGMKRVGRLPSGSLALAITESGKHCEWAWQVSQDDGVADPWNTYYAERASNAARRVPLDELFLLAARGDGDYPDKASRLRIGTARIFMLLRMNIIVTASLPVPLEAESRNDAIYLVPTAPRSGAERQSGNAVKTEPINLAELWDKYHRAREIYEKACASAHRAVFLEGTGHG